MKTRSIGYDSDIVVIVPTNDMGKQDVLRLTSDMRQQGADLIIIEDVYPLFNFSHSMNVGINAALGRKSTKYIVAANDDVRVSCLQLMRKVLDERPEFGYVTPYVNGYDCYWPMKFTRIVGRAIKNKAPFWFLREIRNERFATKLAGGKFLNTQPFAMFRAEVLRKFSFDENFDMGLEDMQLGLRLRQNGIIGFTNPMLNITHKGHATMNILYPIGNAPSKRNREMRNTAYLYKKYSK